MTTGNFSRGSQYGPFYESKSWNGKDGKYVTISSRRRLKYNDWTVGISKQTGTPSTKGYYISCLARPPESSLWNSNDEMSLQAKLVSKIRGHDFNLAVALGEGKQTVSMVRQNLRNMGRAFLAVKRGNFVSALSYLGVGHSSKRSFTSKDVAGRWLELQYGWLPLLSDVHEAAKAFEVASSAPRTSRIRVTRSKKGTYDGSLSPTNWTGLGSYIYSRRITYEMTESSWTARSMGLLDPLTLAWELLPYSFVVDWFIPIGTYLENLNVIPSLTGRFMTNTYWLSVCNGVGLKKTPPGYYEGAMCRSRILTCRRAVTSGLSTARPGFKSLPEALSPRHVWNAIALGRQRFNFEA